MSEKHERRARLLNRALEIDGDPNVGLGVLMLERLDVLDKRLEGLEAKMGQTLEERAATALATVDKYTKRLHHETPA